MRHVDFSPLYRSTVGFDRLFSLLDSMGQPEQSSPAYPPYNIERTGENDYRISMAVAGFGEADLEIEAKENALLVKGNQTKDEASESEILFQGIAARNFERRFQLADHVEVRNAYLENGLLHIELVREIPEAMKARKISIGSKNAKQIEAKTSKSK